MNKKTKNILVAIFVTILIALLGVAAYFIALRMQTEEVVAPTAPESKPSAAETWVGSDDCDTSFVIAQITLTPTATPTDGPTATPTDEPTATPTDEPTATPTDGPTATPTDEPTATPTDGPTATPTDEPTATPTDGPTATPTSIVNTTPTATPAAGLPDAGILSLSGVIAFGGGLLMAILGIILAL